MPTNANMCHSVPTWANIALRQLCRERQAFWNSHDGLNLTCLDQCHCVCCNGTSSRFAQESLPTETGLCRHQCFSVVAQATQDSPKASPRKNFIEQLYKELLLKWMLIERWIRPSMLSSLCQHVPTLQFDSCAEKDSLCGTVMMAWIWHVWINAMVFVPIVLAPPKAGAKDLSYNSLNLIHEFAGLPVDISVFLWLRKQQPRFRKASGQPKCYYQMKELDRTTIYRYCWGEWEMGSSCRGDRLLPFGTWWDINRDPRKLAVWRLSVNDLRMSAVKCSNLRQPHHALETFRPFLVKVTRAAQCDFGLVQLQVNRKLLLNCAKE